MGDEVGDAVGLNVGDTVGDEVTGALVGPSLGGGTGVGATVGSGDVVNTVVRVDVSSSSIDSCEVGEGMTTCGSLCTSRDELFLLVPRRTPNPVQTTTRKMSVAIVIWKHFVLVLPSPVVTV